MATPTANSGKSTSPHKRPGNVGEIYRQRQTHVNANGASGLITLQVYPTIYCIPRMSLFGWLPQSTHREGNWKDGGTPYAALMARNDNRGCMRGTMKQAYLDLGGKVSITQQ